MKDERTRRPTSARDQAEALFKPSAPKPLMPADTRTRIPGAKELVTLRIDRDVLEHFQAGGPGWQDRLNNALRQAAEIGRDGIVKTDDLNSSNDG